jgi:putative membrane protein
MNKDLNIRKMAVCATLAMAFGGAMAQNTGTTGTAATNRDTTANSTTSASSTRTGSDSKVASGDQTMMRDISYSNISEVAAGKLALEKSQSDDVKSFAQKMIDDHTKAQQELQTLADGKGVKLPTEPDAKHKAMAKTLSGLKGDAFDKRYLKEGGLNDHQKTHKLLEKVQAKAKDADLKAYAAKTIAAVDQHLTMAQETAGKHGMGTPKGNMTGAATDNGTMGSHTASGAGTTGNPNSGAGSNAVSGGAGTGATGSSGSATAR